MDSFGFRMHAPGLTEQRAARQSKFRFPHDGSTI
jgi:hypothetical protein